MDFEDVLRSAAMRQLQASQLRFRGTPLATEPARDVYRAACAEIGTALHSLGFKYSRSAHRCVRHVGPFGNVVSFQSSHNNVSGHHVRLWMHGVVTSKALKQWRGGRLPSNLATDIVAGGMVHLLSGVHAMVEWELADQTTRSETIADIRAFIESDVLPYFQRFEHPSSVVDHLAHSEISGFNLRPSVEFAICFGNKDKGQAVLDRFLRERPDLLASIAEFENRGWPLGPYGPSGYAEEVVFMRRTYGLR